MQHAIPMESVAQGVEVIGHSRSIQRPWRFATLVSGEEGKGWRAHWRLRTSPRPKTKTRSGSVAAAAWFARLSVAHPVLRYTGASPTWLGSSSSHRYLFCLQLHFNQRPALASCSSELKKNISEAAPHKGPTCFSRFILAGPFSQGGLLTMPSSKAREVPPPLPFRRADAP
jgi:hypothetical protein